MSLDLFTAASARARLDAAAAALDSLDGSHTAIIVAASRAAADEFALRAAARRGGLFGVVRTGFIELATRLALPTLAKRGLTPTSALGETALATRVAFDARADDALGYFQPIGDMPGFPGALGRTLSELRLARIGSPIMERSGGRPELSELLARVTRARQSAGTADLAEILETAAVAVPADPHLASADLLVLLDVPLNTAAERAFLQALVKRSRRTVATSPSSDTATLAAYRAIGATVHDMSVTAQSALSRLQQHLFAEQMPPAGTLDDSVVVFSAPGENREAVEIARRILQEAGRGVRFDEIAVLLRAPQAYLGVLEHALARAGVPAWFHRGTRRPDPSGRAFLALLACADERLSARRFAEYISLSQVPMGDEPRLDAWTPPADEVTAAIVAVDDRPSDIDPEKEAAVAAQRTASREVIAGTVRAPWRWEDLIVEAVVIEGIDRWERRLDGLRNEYARRLREIQADDPESPRARALARDVDQLQALAAFALPILREMAQWPHAQTWEGWLDAFRALAQRVLRDPSRVIRVLQELAPLAGVGPVTLREVRGVLTPRLATLTHEPRRRRQGRVFVGTPHAARGRAFRVVFVPGLAERVFPQRIREDALLLDEARRAISDELRVRDDRVVEERLHLTLATGTATERVYVSFPRMDANESRPRVPSFYVLDVARAIEGTIPSATMLAAKAFHAGQSTLAWPAPADPQLAIDDVEHDLATLAGLLNAPDAAAAKGRARYLYELSPELRRSLTSRWVRWHRRGWDTADGLVRSVEATTAPMLRTQRLTTRPYSLSALQRFSSCPYQFLLAAIYRLAPRTAPAPLQRLDPLTRGDLFHRMQAGALRRLREHHLLPVTAENLPRAQKLLEWAVTEVEQQAHDDLAPAIERVWRDEIAALTRDLKIWLEKLSEEGAEWVPEFFEFSFGLDDRVGRDSSSVADAARVDGRFLLRGSIDLIERHRRTGLLRVTDHKTGKNRTERGKTVVQGGRVLQPVIYGLALESVWPGQTVFSGRLSFCTTAGGFSEHEIHLLENSRRHGVEVLEIIDRSIERGVLAAMPAVEACASCDFDVVCGRHEEHRTRKKHGDISRDLEALRQLP